MTALVDAVAVRVLNLVLECVGPVPEAAAACRALLPPPRLGAVHGLVRLRLRGHRRVRVVSYDYRTDVAAAFGLNGSKV